MHVVEDDFTVMSPDVFEATFTSGSMIGDTACDNITIVDDSVLEGTQSFSIQISGSTPSGGQIMTAGPSTDVFIVDNEGTHCITFVTKNYVSDWSGEIRLGKGVKLCGELLWKLTMLYLDLDFL